MITTSEEEEQQAFVDVEAAYLLADRLRGVVKCTPYQEKIYACQEDCRRRRGGQARPQAEEALWLLDKRGMGGLVEAKRLNWTSSEVAEITSLLSLPEEKLVEMQLKRAVKLQDPKRMQNEIRCATCTSPSTRLRTALLPTAALAAQVAGAVYGLASIATGRSGRARHNNARAPAAPPPLADRDTTLECQGGAQPLPIAPLLGRQRNDPCPSAQGHLFLQSAMESKELRAEVYMQLPSSSPQPAEAGTGTAQKYWDMLALTLLCAPPDAGCDDFVHAYVVKHAPDAASRRRLVAQIHKGRYKQELLTELPPADRLPDTARAFFGLRGKAASRFSAEDLITASMHASEIASPPSSPSQMPPTPPPQAGLAPQLTPPDLHERQL